MYIEFEVEIGAKTICSFRYKYKYMYIYVGLIHCYFYHYCASIVFSIRFFRNSVTVNNFQHYEKTVLQWRLFFTDMLGESQCINYFSFCIIKKSLWLHCNFITRHFTCCNVLVVVLFQLCTFRAVLKFCAPNLFTFPSWLQKTHETFTTTSKIGGMEPNNSLCACDSYFDFASFKMFFLFLYFETWL